MTRQQDTEAKMVTAVAYMALLAWLVRPGNDYAKRVISRVVESVGKRTGSED